MQHAFPVDNRRALLGLRRAWPRDVQEESVRVRRHHVVGRSLEALAIFGAETRARLTPVQAQQGEQARTRIGMAGRQNRLDAVTRETLTVDGRSVEGVARQKLGHVDGATATGYQRWKHRIQFTREFQRLRVLGRQAEHFHIVEPSPFAIAHAP